MSDALQSGSAPPPAGSTPPPGSASSPIPEDLSPRQTIAELRARRDAGTPDGGEPQRPQQQQPQADKVLTADGREGIKLGERVFAPEELTALAERAAAEDVRKASLPTTAADYKLELPSDFKLPPGVSITFAENDPILGPVIEQARDWAHQQGFSREQWSKMLSFHAATLVHERDMLNRARQAEIAKLGPGGSSMVDAVSTFLRAQLGDELAKPLLSTMATAAHVEAYLKLAGKVGGAGTFSQSHREPPRANNSPSDEQWAQMSARERYAYAQSAREQ
jgi:hypothetical protein